MPAMLEDPTASVIYRTSGVPPYPSLMSSEIPPNVAPRQVTLRDRVTIASLLPFSTASSIPPRLLSYLCQQLNLEIEKGDTYPMISPMSESTFGTYWFQNFGAVMILGEIAGADYVQQAWRMEEQGLKWELVALGSFYIKPNYPGRSSHVCNGGFLVTEAARNRGVGRLMGEGYLEWAPKLGYTYSVFNLVYETNVASCRIWDALGFKRIGRIKSCGNLRSHPESFVDAIIYGRDLGPEGEDYVSEERFEKIRFYLKHGKYPTGADRMEKSRLRSAATHYKLLPAEEGTEGQEDAERLMLRDKEVVSDPQRQYEIARKVHVSGQHGGINKTTATIAEKFHWVRIKETVSLVIRNCRECKENAAKLHVPIEVRHVLNSSESGMLSDTAMQSTGQSRNNPNLHPQSDAAMYDRLVDFAQTTNAQPELRTPTGQVSITPLGSTSGNDGSDNSQLRAPLAHMGPSALPSATLSDYAGIPLDPQIMATATHPHSGQSPYQTHSQQMMQGQGEQHQQGPHAGTQFYAHQQHPTQLSSSSSSRHSPYPQAQAMMHGPHDPQKQSDGLGGTSHYGGTQDLDAELHLERLAAYNSRTDEDGGTDGFDVDHIKDFQMMGVQAQAQMSKQEQMGRHGDDTRLATDRHIKMGDDPLASR